MKMIFIIADIRIITKNKIIQIMIYLMIIIMKKYRIQNLMKTDIKNIIENPLKDIITKMINNRKTLNLKIMKRFQIMTNDNNNFIK